MPAGLEARGDDGIDAGRLKGRTLVWRGRRADRDHAFRAALFQDFPWRNPTDEAEYGDLLVQQDASLILKSHPRIGLVLRTGHSQGCKISSKRRKASIEGVLIRTSSTFVFRRYPQVHC